MVNEGRRLLKEGALFISAPSTASQSPSPMDGNAIALRRIQKVHVIMMCAFFFTHFSPVNNKINFFPNCNNKLNTRRTFMQ
jgi:hypothetical protein